MVTLAALASRSQGFPVQHLSLNDGGVWITDKADGQIGRFNKPIDQVDGAIVPATAAGDMNVWQAGGLVATYSGGKVYSVNPATTAFTDDGTQAPITSNAQAALNGAAFAVIGADHKLRAAPMTAPGASVQSVAASSTPLDKATLPGNAAVAVDSDSDILVAGGGLLRRYPAAADGTSWGKAQATSLNLPGGDQLQVTTIGDVPVVADITSGKIYLPASNRPVSPLPSPAGLALQQSSAASPYAYAATSTALYQINLANGTWNTVTSGRTGTATAPVQVSGCAHAAWANGGSATYVRACAGTPAVVAPFLVGSDNPDLVFRVNHNQVVLNDTANGDVFLLDSKVIRIQPQWQQFIKRDNKDSNSPIASPEATPLQAKPDTQGVRPGRTTVVHVLDNDSGPLGALLAVVKVGPPDQSQVSVAVAPDGQTVLATVGPGLTTNAHFEYTIDDGKGHTASAQVTLQPRQAGENSPPRLRDNYDLPDLSVASGGHLIIAVVGDWRDPDGDPLYVDDNSDPSGQTLSVTGAGGGTVGIASGGAISYTAPQVTSTGAATIHYAVTDGISATPQPGKPLTVTVLATTSTHLVSPKAEPDVAQAIVGMPATIKPLGNDTPGADPTDPQAHLTIAGPARLVTQAAGATVSTDVHAGTVTFTAKQPGAYFLTYQAAFGATVPSTGTIRVQVSPKPGTPKPPVPVPDLAVLHGQQPALVDVLANDYDPQGYVLGVTSASSTDAGIHVAVVSQHWLRISADNPVPGSASTASYIVSNGYATATGTVSITAEPATSDDQVTTQDASVTIRAGDSAAVAVLANDSSSAGLALSLGTTPPQATPPIAGLFASNQGGTVRVDAPANVTTQQETTVSYVATDASGTTATGQLFVTVEPPPSKANPDQAPSPQAVTTRETAGDVAVIEIPTYGIDPDGDSTTVTAVTGAPTLGRIVAVTPNSIRYQSYPASSGTDTFTYQVTDPYGMTGTGQVSIAVLPPGPPQPPVAVDDVLSAPPGATVHVDVLGNDVIAPGDPVTVAPLDQTNKSLPPGARLNGSFVYLKAPASPADPPAQLTYGATDGSTAPSQAQVIVRAVTGAKLAPIANDDIATPASPSAATVTVNVLKNDDDPVGSASDLKLSWAPAGVTKQGPSLVIPVKANPREVPYQVTAPDGLTATAVVFVPGTATSAIRLKEGARITLPPRGSVTVPLASVLTDSFGRPLRITTTDQLTSSPAGNITVTTHQDTSFQVQAQGTYAGPGAVSVQVYDGSTIQDPKGHVATLTIPVQVGADTPVLRCPSGNGNALQVVEGGASATYNISLLCHVWTDTTIATAAPRYAAGGWTTPVTGVTATIVGNGTGLRLLAASSAKAGDRGTLRITADGAAASSGGLLSVTVVAAPPPSGRAVSLATNAGQPAFADLAQYVSSPLPQPAISIPDAPKVARASVTVSGSRLTVTPEPSFHGTLQFVVTVADEPGRVDRQIQLAVSVSVIARPGAPGPPSAKTSSHTAQVFFSPAAPNGAPVQLYTVFTDRQGHQCAASPCTISGLANGHSYDVYVTATNSAGQGAASLHGTAKPDEVPSQITGLNTTPGDQQVTLTWPAAPDGGSPVQRYLAEVSPAPASGASLQKLAPSARSVTFTGLTNGTSYSFRVQASNSLGPGPWSAAVPMTPYGKPLTMGAPTATGAAVPNPATTRAITVSWAAGQDNGNAITGYTVTPYSSGSSGGPWTAGTPAAVGGGTTSTSFTVTNDGTYYEYTVTATNAAGDSTPSPQSSPPVQGIAPPDAPATPSAADHDASTGKGYDGAIQVTFTAPNGNGGSITSVEYGLNGQSTSGTWNGPFTAGASVTQTASGLANGSNYVVYVRGCNSLACGPWSSASNQVTPYGAPGAPTNVTAASSGTTISYSWGGGAGNGRPLDHYIYCIDGANCQNSTGTTASGSYGYSSSHNVTVYAVDSAGQQSAGATSNTATTAAPPSPTVSISRGPNEPTATCTSGSGCSAVHVIGNNFTPGATLTYTCSDNHGGTWWTDTRAWGGALVKADGSGHTDFETNCVWGNNNWSLSNWTLTINVSDGSKSASGSYTG
jgi:large repetitive protein